jgi:hypothetical protein
VGGQQAGGLAAVRHAEAAQHAAHPMVDGVGRDVQLAGDFLGPHAAEDHAQDFAVPLRQQRDGLFVGVVPLPHGVINDEDAHSV